MSWLGFSTQKEAIYALDNDGVAPKDIAIRLGCKTSTVYARLSTKRQLARLAAGIDDDMKAKARRIHFAGLKVIAEALGLTLDVLRAVVLEQPAAFAVGATVEEESDQGEDQPFNGQNGNADDLDPPPDEPADDILDQLTTGQTVNVVTTAAETDHQEAVAWRHNLTGVVRLDRPSLNMGLNEDYTALFSLPPDDVEAPAPAAALAAPTSKPKGEVKSRPDSAKPADRIYGLKTIDGKWLTKNGKGFTSVPV